MNTTSNGRGSRILAAVLGAALVGVSAGTASANGLTFYVAPAPFGNDTSGSGTTVAPYASIGKALTQVTTNDTICVGAGTYTENLTIAASMSSITIQGGYKTNDWSWNPSNQVTVIKPTTTANFPMTMASSNGTHRLSALTLTGATDGGGAGLLFDIAQANVVLDGCTITNNNIGLRLYFPNTPTTLTLRNCLIARNAGNGIHSSCGGGNPGWCYLYNCTIANNGNDGFQTIGNDDAHFLNLAATNTLFTGNGGYGINMQQRFSTTDYCLFYGNTNGATFSRNTDGGHSKLEVSAKYVGEALGNYRLQTNSPAAAAGRDLSGAGVTNDIEGTARPQGGAWDMGAFEGSGSGEPLVASAYVSKSGDNSTGDGSTSTPWATVTYGVTRLAASGTLYVAGGIYTGNVVIASNKSSITIRGGYDTNGWSWNPTNQVTLKPTSTANTPMTVLSTNGTHTLEYLTLTGATGSGYAGLLLDAGTPGYNLVLNGCAITNNDIGIKAYSPNVPATLTLRNCLIAKNTQKGIWSSCGENPSGWCYLYNCTIANNGSDGFYTIGNSDATFLNLSATNTLFTGNGGYGIEMSGRFSTTDYCLFYGNTSGPWSGTRNTDGGHSITNQDPLYVSVASNNYQITTLSPAFNSGTDLRAAGVTMDILGLTRPEGGVFDRGAYEVDLPNGTVISIR
jgi:hypothetical protein